MKTIPHRFIPCFPVLLLLMGCTGDVFSSRDGKHQNSPMSIHASTENAQTKTLLSGEPGDPVRSICFLPLDSIAFSADLGEFKPFVNISSDTLPYATFSGDLIDAGMYVAFYPWKLALNLNRDTLLTLKLPYTQQYKAGGFASGAYPMVSWSYDTNLHFKNLCGLLKLNLCGDVSVSSLSLCAPGLAGVAGVDMRYQGVPQLIMPTPPAYDTLTLDCGEGVQLDDEQATAFYFVLPPALYESVTLIVRTTDHQQMTETTQNLRIVRSSITPTSVIEFDSDDNPNPPGNTVLDIQGNVYKTVAIGNQIWMAENLKSTLLNDGTEIPHITDNSSWNSLTTPGYCRYDNDQTLHSDYGLLYNWFTVETGKLCPQGWHVPSHAEWTELTDYLGGESIAGNKLKESGTGHWAGSNPGSTNETGFTGLPGGLRNNYGVFQYLGYGGFWWSATEGGGGVWYRYVYFDDSAVYAYDNGLKELGFSVRCVKSD
jgi:uncharacterized protein (TIGR02145 family)